MFAMLFSDLLPAAHVNEMLSAYSQEIEAKLAQIDAPDTKPRSEGERFANGMGRAVYTAMRSYLNDYRARAHKAAAAE
jgi:hypothetical protein